MELGPDDAIGLNVKLESAMEGDEVGRLGEADTAAEGDDVGA